VVTEFQVLARRINLIGFDLTLGFLDPDGMG
jgi:hypothetical protein